MPEDGLDSGSDRLFRTQKRAILETWDQMQRLQTDFAFAQELTFYYTSPQWRTAQTVLDLGTGNGYYLTKLAACFPDKRYVGIDVSPELIALAEKEAGAGNVSFSHRNLFDITEPCNFVLIRLLLQHRKDVPAILDHVATLISPGESALIIDAHDPSRLFHPDLPEFTEFFAAYADHERKAGRDRCVAGRVEEAIAASTQWRLGSTLPLLIPSTIPNNLERFTRTYTLLVDLVELAGELQHDFAAVKESWRQWSERPDAYTQVGLTVIRLDRV
jgi:SAM-dependent methyltransferase